MLNKFGNSAFTLIEVLIAMAILSIGLLAITSMTVMVTKSNYKSKNMTMAIDLAQNKLDDLKVTSYASIPTGPATDTSGIFSRKVTSSENNNPNYKIVDVEVTWDDPTSRAVSLKTIIAE